MCARANPNRWQGHPATQTWRDTLQVVKKRLPKCVILENVTGFADRGPDDSMSPLDITISELRASGYNTVGMSLDMNAWVTCSRQRIDTQCMCACPKSMYVPRLGVVNPHDRASHSFRVDENYQSAQASTAGPQRPQPQYTTHTSSSDSWLNEGICTGYDYIPETGCVKDMYTSIGGSACHCRFAGASKITKRCLRETSRD
jgi:hypothetical protein